MPKGRDETTKSKKNGLFWARSRGLYLPEKTPWKSEKCGKMEKKKKKKKKKKHTGGRKTG